MSLLIYPTIMVTNPAIIPPTWHVSGSFSLSSQSLGFLKKKKKFKKNLLFGSFCHKFTKSQARTCCRHRT
jgi:hypothetical protein